MDIKLIVLGLIGIGIKLLLIPAYFSTDFDVHHNWLRITFTKPLSEWYFDDQSKWTLDYPPFFAYFEYFLACIANLIDPHIMKLIVTNKVLYFQRISVIVTEIPFLYVLYIIFNRKVTTSLVFSYLFIPLIILDSKIFSFMQDIHFQYNIMLQTVFLISVYFLVRKQNYLIAALIYSILLNFKHIYLYCSIAYFLLILKNYVLKQDKGNKDQNQNQQKIIKFAKVGLITILPFLFSFGPFIVAGGTDGIKQIFSRLFPFGRGLIHDYWAPNFWALYFFADKILSFILRVVFKHESIEITSINSSQKALNYLKVLPQPSANITLLIIISCLVPLIAYAIRAKKVNSLRLILINGLVFFMFGYHVHEKAITPYLHLCYVFFASDNGKNQMSNQKNQYISIPENQKHQQLQKSVTIVSSSQSKIDIIQVLCVIFFNIFSLFPLLIDLKEKPLKITIAIIYFLILKLKISESLKKGDTFQLIVYKYLLNCCFGLVILCELVIPFMNWTNGNKYEFLPLMVNSVSCALVNFIWTFKLYYTQLKLQS